MAPSQQRREREKQEVRERILEAARELFVSHGYEAVTMRQIAEKIEYTPTAIYFHFKDKQELINELCAIDFLRLASVFNELSGEADPLKRLRATAFAYLDFALKNPQHYRLLFMAPHPYQPPQANKLIRHGNPAEDAYAFLRTIVIECIALGRFKKQHRDPELIAQMLWSAVHGIASLHIARGDDHWIAWRDAKETLELMLEAIMRGIRSDVSAGSTLAPNRTARTWGTKPQKKAGRK